jgi:hypothetical protein
MEKGDPREEKYAEIEIRCKARSGNKLPEERSAVLPRNWAEKTAYSI